VVACWDGVDVNLGVFVVEVDCSWGVISGGGMGAEEDIG
jgi:hypothetical protein